MGHDPRPLTSTEGGVDLASSRLAHESPRPLAHDAPTRAASEAFPYCRLCTGIGPEDTGVRARSSDRPACPAMLGAGGGDASVASKATVTHRL